jgi:hypothetical protein
MIDEDDDHQPYEVNHNDNYWWVCPSEIEATEGVRSLRILQQLQNEEINNENNKEKLQDSKDDESSRIAPEVRTIVEDGIIYIVIDNRYIIATTDVNFGLSVKNPSDKFNLEIGKALAFYRKDKKDRESFK